MGIKRTVSIPFPTTPKSMYLQQVADILLVAPLAFEPHQEVLTPENPISRPILNQRRGSAALNNLKTTVSFTDLEIERRDRKSKEEKKKEKVHVNVIFFRHVPIRIDINALGIVFDFDYHAWRPLKWVKLASKSKQRENLEPIPTKVS